MKANRSTARVVVLAVTAALVLTIFAPLASFAGSTGSRNTAIGLAGVAAYLLIKGKTVPGIASAAGAAYAYKQYQDKRDDERARARYWDNSRNWGRGGTNYRDDDRNRYSDERDRDRDYKKHHDKHTNNKYGDKHRGCQ